MTRFESGQRDGHGTGNRWVEEWARVRGRVRAEAGDAAFRSWLKPLTLVSIRQGVVRMAVPTRFMRDWVLSNYVELLMTLWSEEIADLKGIEVVVQPPRKPAAPHPTQSPEPSVAASDAPGAMRGAAAARELRGMSPYARPAVAPVTKPASVGPTASVGSRVAQQALGDTSAPLPVRSPLDERFTFEQFVVGKSNEFAYAAARRVAESGTVPFNPLFLYGPVGLGKTHLMHAIAWEIRRRTPERSVIYLSAEAFMYQFVNALRTKDTVAFKQQFRSVDVLMIDDFHFIGGRDATQEEFFHTFNALVDQNRQVVISADKSPSDLEGVEERMRSRLGWGLVADIHPTTYELRLGILQAKAEQCGVPVPAKVLEFLAHKITSNVRELEGALTRITAHASFVGRPVTLEATQEILQDLLRATERRITIDEIQKRVAEHFNVRVADMHSARRSRAVARPRQVAMYLSKQLTSRSLPEIGRKFGGRDHTTVMHAVRRIEQLRTDDPSFAENVDLLRRMLET